MCPAFNRSDVSSILTGPTLDKDKLMEEKRYYVDDHEDHVVVRDRFSPDVEVIRLGKGRVFRKHPKTGEGYHAWDGKAEVQHANVVCDRLNNDWETLQ